MSRRTPSTLSFELKMSQDTACRVMAGSIVTAVGCVIGIVLYGSFDYGTTVLYALTVGGVLCTSYASHDKKEQTIGLARKYGTVFMLITLTASIAAVGYEYGTHETWNAFPLLICLPLAFGLACVLRRKVRAFKITVLHDCINMVRGRHPSKETRED
jgi:cytochrome bd-type quinol oxidase subunit 2